MKNQNEYAAVSDVTARMREEASILSLLNGQSLGVASVVNKLREFADSIDAASQRVASKMHALQLELWQGKKMGAFAFALALDGFESALSTPTAPAKLKAESTQPKSEWSVKDALDFANTLANHGWTQAANADAASSCIYALCRMLKDCGNAAAMRDALLKAIVLLKVCEWPDDTPMQDVKELIDEIEKASFNPPRNCDVGTAEEQAQRYDRFCEEHDCVGCPVHALWRHYFGICKKVSCGLIWAQMPYEEGDKK